MIASDYNIKVLCGSIKKHRDQTH